MRRMRLREWLVCLKVTVSDDQLITPMTAISCWLVVVLCPFQPTAWLPCQLAVAIRYCEQGEWVYSHAIRSSWVSQQDASVGINMWQETNGFRCKALHLLLLRLCRTANLLVLFAPLDHFYPRIRNLMSLVLFWCPLFETFERLCILLATLTLLNFYKNFQIFYLFEDKINAKIVIGILFLVWFRSSRVITLHPLSQIVGHTQVT